MRFPIGRGRSTGRRPRADEGLFERRAHGRRPALCRGLRAGRPLRGGALLHGGALGAERRRCHGGRAVRLGDAGRLRRAERPARRIRLLPRGMARMGLLGEIAGQPPNRRGARLRALGHQGGGPAVRGRRGPLQQRHPHRELRARGRPRQAQRQEAGGAAPKRPRYRGHRRRQDLEVLHTQHPADERGLLRHRLEGHAAAAARQRAGGERLRDQLHEPGAHVGLGRREPFLAHPRRGGDHRVRGVLHREHHRRQGPRGRPVLGAGRAPALHRPHRLPDVLLPARGPQLRRARHPALAGAGQGGRR